MAAYRHTADDLRSIALAGGGMIVDAMYYSVSDFRSILLAGQSAGATLTVRNAWRFSSIDLRSIALAGRGRVVFDFTSEGA
jgi:hypothetical protein